MEGIAAFLQKHRIAASVISIVLAILIITFVIISALSIRRSNLILLGIDRLDVLIEEGRLDQSEDLLERLLISADSPGDYLSLIKRGKLLQELAGVEPQSLPLLYKNGFSQYPGNDLIRAIYVEYLLGNSQYRDATEIAQGLGGRQWRSLQIEARLRAGLSVDQGEVSGLMNSVVLPLTAERMADPQAMIEAGLLTEDYRYFVNGAAMYAALGRYKDAYDILYARRNLLRNTSDARLLMLLAYHGEIDADIADLASLLPAQVALELENLSLRADLHFYQGSLTESYNFHRIATQRSNDKSLQNYINLLSLIRGYGLEEPGDLTNIFDESLEYYSDNEEIIVQFLAQQAETDVELYRNDYAYYSSRMSDSAALELLSGLFEYRNRFDADSDFLTAELISTLWTLSNAGNSDARRMLAYFLTIANERSSLATMSRNTPLSSRGEELFFRGNLNFLQGNIDSSAENYEESASHGIYAAAYNLGLLYLSERRIADALSEFTRAEVLLRRYSGNSASDNGSFYFNSYVKIRAYTAFCLALLNQDAQAAEILSELQSLEAKPLILARIKDLIAYQE